MTWLHFEDFVVCFFFNTGKIVFCAYYSTFCYFLHLSNICPSPPSYPPEDKYVTYRLGSSGDQQLCELTESMFSLHTTHRNCPSHSSGVPV